MNNRDILAVERQKKSEIEKYMQMAEDGVETANNAKEAALKVIQDEAREVFEGYRVKNRMLEAEAERIIKKIKSVNDLKRLKEILAEIEDAEAFDRVNKLTSGKKKKQYKKAVKKCDTEMKALGVMMAWALFNVLLDVATEAYLRTFYDLQRQTGIGYKVSPPDRKSLIREIIAEETGSRATDKKIFKSVLDTSEALKREILKGVLTGRSQFDTLQSLKGEVRKKDYEIARIIRTETTYIANQKQIEAMKQAGIKKYMYLAILDTKTSSICRELDKKVFDVDKAQAGVNLPPMHPNCRSTIIAQMPSQYMKGDKQNALDVQNSHKTYVPKDMSYEEWYKQYVRNNAQGNKLMLSDSVEDVTQEYLNDIQKKGNVIDEAPNIKKIVK